MMEKRFLRRMSSLLSSLPQSGRREELENCRRLLEERIRSGLPEREAVAELGDVRALAQKILSEHPERRGTSAGRVAAIAVLSFAGVVLVSGLTFMVLGTVGYRGIETVPTASSAAGPAPQQEQGEDRQYVTEADGIEVIRVGAQNKKIHFVAEDTDGIAVDYRDETGQQYEFSREGGVLTVSNRDGRLNDSLPGFTLGDAADRVTLHLPADYSGEVIVKTTNSAITASGFQKLDSFRCETSNAAILMSDVSARLLAFDTGNAGISLQNVAASESLTATTRNAAISLERISSPGIYLYSENALIRGIILGDEEDYAIQAETSNGACNLKDRSGGGKSLFVQTSNALIDLRFEQ